MDLNRLMISVFLLGFIFFGCNCLLEQNQITPKEARQSNNSTKTEKDGLLMAKNRVPGEYIVTFREEISQEQVHSQLKEFELVKIMRVDGRMCPVRNQHYP